MLDFFNVVYLLENSVEISRFRSQFLLSSFMTEVSIIEKPVIDLQWTGFYIIGTFLIKDLTWVDFITIKVNQWAKSVLSH